LFTVVRSWQSPAVVSADARRIERVQVTSVTRLFGATPALRGVSASFRAGTISLLEGPNGAGKSTLLSVIATVLAPTSGDVEYLPLGKDRTLVRAHIGWVAHDAHCYRELTARENIELAARLYGADPRASWERVSERVAARAFADRSVGTLSRGQRQRVALARALVHQPSVLLLDEPWSGLDAASSDQLEQVLREERAAHTIVIVVSHGGDQVARLADERIRLENGRIAQPSV
jgi:ABC-type multidrug transport system ATPase subunit